MNAKHPISSENKANDDNNGTQSKILSLNYIPDIALKTMVKRNKKKSSSVFTSSNFILENWFTRHLCMGIPLELVL